MVEFMPLSWAIGAMAVSVLGLLSVGVKLVTYADAIADRFKLGEALVGGLFLGAITSLSGSIVSGLSAYNGFEELAINNCLGGIAAQTTFLIIADMTYRKVNLEHAAASLPNLVSCNLLIALIGVALVSTLIPVPSWLFVHPGSVLLLALYIVGLGWLKETYERPQWFPRKTKETREDVPEEQLSESTKALVTKFLSCAITVAILGYLITLSAESLIQKTTISENIIGGFITSIITSLPELVVSITAVRKGALTMAVANILGGNSFDVLMIVIADFLTFDSTIYESFGKEELYFAFINILMTAIIAVGLARREKTGWGAIGFEGVAILSIYALSFGLIAGGLI